MKRFFFLLLIVVLSASCSEPSASSPESSDVSPRPEEEVATADESDDETEAAPEDSVPSSSNERMTGAKLEAILREVIGDKLFVQGPIIEFVVQDISLTCIYDETHDRMRVISPVKSYSEVTDEERDLMLQANFHSALDARYAVSDNVVFSAFIHPLSSLTRDDFLSGILQVASLKVSFGESYSSGILQFQEPDLGPAA